MADQTVLERLKALHAKLTAELEPVRAELHAVDNVVYDATGANGSDPVRRALSSCEQHIDALLADFRHAVQLESEHPTEQLGAAPVGPEDA